MLGLKEKHIIFAKIWSTNDIPPLNLYTTPVIFIFHIDNLHLYLVKWSAYGQEYYRQRWRLLSLMAGDTDKPGMKKR